MSTGYRGRRRAARTTSLRAHRALIATVIVSLGFIAAGPIPQSAQAAEPVPAIQLSKKASGSILAGDAVSYTLTATNSADNPAAAPEYNVSFRDVLPAGVRYRAGSTSPSDLGEPTIITDQDGRQTLIWRDTADLQVGAEVVLRFDADTDPAVYPVASTVSNTANAYASTAPRVVPKFTAAGAPVTDTNVQAATSAEVTTSVSALKVTKSEPSPESKLLRGVHDRSTVYTVKVTNTSRAATNATTVTDYLPAQLEFLGCGGVDNSTAAEHDGAPRLTGTPTVPSDCPTPASVSTVSDPAPDGAVSYPAGVYTKVVWNVGTLAAGQSVTITYRAGVPLKANQPFTGGPSATSLGQAANLDNNTGDSTRQVGEGAPQTNYVHAAGRYTGPVAANGSADVVADAKNTVTIHDLRVLKSASPGEFVAGQVSTYTLRIDSGEYTDSSAITVTDVLPNGICPLDDVANHTSGAPAECAPGAGFAPSVPFQSVTQNADGTFTVVFQPLAVAKNGTTTITYQGRNRTTYTGGALAGRPPAAGDTFTNRAREQATTTPVPATGVTGTQTVRDATSATQTTSFGTLAKTVAARATPMTCADATFGTTTPVFLPGDRACFEVRVPFSTTNQTRNAVVTDFLPENTTYEAGSVTYPASNTVDTSQIAFDSAGAASGALSWKVGAARPDGTTEVPVGKVFVARFSVIVTGAVAGPAPDKTGNIVKLRTANSRDNARSSRDAVDFRLAAAPPVSITKGVESVNGGAGNPANVDNVQVKQGDAVRYRLDFANGGTSANANDVPVSDVEIWDVLPAGVACARVSAVSGGGTCTDPGGAGHPSFAQSGSRSAITWKGLTTLEAGARRTFVYTVTMPDELRVSTSLVNTASVRSYTTATDRGTTTTHYPKNNVDTSVAAADMDVPAASDASEVHTPGLGLTKGVASNVNESGNTGNEATPRASTQATVGERVTYTVSGTVPAGTTVYQGSITDTLPPGQTLQSSTLSYQPDASSTTTAPLPSGVRFTDTTATLELPATYTNGSATDQRFTVTIVATLDNTANNSTHNQSRTNTAQFKSTTTASTTTAGPSASANANVQLVLPSPSVTKVNNAGTSASGGQTITYTLTPTNGAGRPPLHDGWVVDCLPAGLTFTGYGTPPAGVTTTPAAAGDGTNGCATGSTRLAWNIGDLAGGASRALTYTATVDPTSAGKATLVNTVSLTGGTLAGNRTSPTDQPAGRAFTVSNNSTVTVRGATALKSVSPSSATVGQTVTYTTSAVLPSGVNFYNLSLIDTLPAGIDPASVTATGTTCINADSTACSLTSASPLSSTPASGGATTIGWFLGDAASGGQVRTVTVRYTAKVADTAAAVRGAGLVNRMHVSWDSTSRTAPSSAGASFNQSSTDATATVTVLEPSLSIAKSAATTRPEPGERIDYTVKVTNANTGTTSAASNVTISDTVPTGVVVDPASISLGGTITGADATRGGGTIAWSVPGSIAKNADVTLTYSATLAPSSTLTAAGLVNTARITGYDSLDTGGRHYTGGTSTATVTPAFPKVATAKSTPNGTTAYLDESFTWRVTVTNTGAGSAREVGAVDTLPRGWTYDADSARASVDGGASTAVEPTTSTTDGVQTLRWTRLGTLPTGKAVVITYTAKPSRSVVSTPGVGTTVQHVNTVTASAEDATGATSNASGSFGSGAATAGARIASADLSIAKKVGTKPTAGRSGTWTLTVTNDGPDTATGPIVVTDDFTDPLPDGVSNVRAVGTGWDCAVTTPIRCTRPGTLAKGASAPVITVTYDLDSDAAPDTTLRNGASVSGRTYDPNPENDDAEASTGIDTSADLGVAKTLSSRELVAGEPVSYALRVSNAGPSTAVGPITLTDDVPDGTTFVSAAGDGWECQEPEAGAPAGSTVTCTLDGPLKVGDVPGEVVVTVEVDAARTEAVKNTASVSSRTTDPDESNDSSSVTTTPVVRTSVSIKKQHVTSPFVAGDPVDYKIDVVNAGPSSAAGVKVTDQLPDELTYDSFSSDDDWTCKADGQDVTCDFDGPLAPGSTSLVITAVLDPDFDVSQRVVNTARVSTTSGNSVDADDSSEDDSTVEASADLEIKKTSTGDTVAGEGLTYHLDVTNKGPSSIPGVVTVTDRLPAGLVYRSATGTGWGCDYDADTRVVTCTLDAGLSSRGEAPRIDVATTVASDVGVSTITNIARVSSEIADPDPDNNVSDTPVGVTTRADVSLTKRLSSASPAVAGTDARFTLVASNAGPSDAQEVTVTDTLPEWMSYRSFTGAGWDCEPNGQDVVCSRDSVSAGGSAPDLVIIARIASGTPVDLPEGTTTLVNQASVDMATDGDVSEPVSVDVPVQARADLALVKSASTKAVAGRTMTWAIAVSNEGPSDAAGPLTVRDTLPRFQTYVSSSAGWDCTADDAPSTPGDGRQSVVCTTDEGLVKGADAPELEIETQIDASAPAGEVTNEATASSSTPGEDGEGEGEVTTTRDADLSIVKSHAGTGTIGQDLAFTLAVRNDGPSVADQVVVTDELPAGLDFVSAEGTDWSCEEVEGAVRCELDGTLAPSADAPAITVTTTVRADAFPSVTNTATVGSDDPDLTGTDSDDDLVEVDPSATLRLEKEHVGELVVGQEATYRLTVTNDGPTLTPGPLTLTDDLPEGLDFVKGAGDGWSCDETSGSVTCDREDGLAVDEDTEVELTVRVGASAYPSVTNVARVTGTGSEPAEDDDTAPVTPTSDLGIEKKVSNVKGRTATYAITVTNHGPSDTVAPVVVTDPLPRGLEHVSSGGPGWECTVAVQDVTCLHDGSMEVGESATITLVATITARAGEKVVNIASVGGGTGSQTVTPSDPAELVAPSTDGDGAGPGAGSDGSNLPWTGAAVHAGLVLLALLVVLLGVALVLAARSRRREV